ncbi:MAG: protein kinase [Verrucomicrobia bacterium]|nr:protein kinase [Verrucomicrobiota bacterium]
MDAQHLQDLGCRVEIAGRREHQAERDAGRAPFTTELLHPTPQTGFVRTARPVSRHCMFVGLHLHGGNVRRPRRIATGGDKAPGSGRAGPRRLSGGGLWRRRRAAPAPQRQLAAHEQSGTRLATQDAVQPTIKLDLAEAPDEAVGQTISRYKLLEKIGEGGCGVVYVAEQTEPVRRRVALKVIKLGTDTQQVVARFEAERQALAMMDHPSLAKVLDAGMVGKDASRSADSPAGAPRNADFPVGKSAGKGEPPRAGWKTGVKGRPHLVMELVRGIPITHYCDQAQLTTQERLDLFIKVCQAIQHAHQKGIIHRDIKPSNILVTLHDGVPVPKVIDFGIAKATEGRLTDATVYTQLHQFIGTPAYMSPEQAEMSGLDIDTRSDIYSLGVLLYELLVGKTPFDAQELMSGGIDAMRRTIREKDPVRPSTRLATLPGEELTTTAKRRSADAPKLIHLLKGDLDWIVMKCLEKDRTRRYDTANGLAADLKRHLNNEPVVARPPSAAYRLQKAFRRNKLAFTAAAAVSLALLLGIAISTWQMLAARQAQREAEAARSREQQQRMAAETAQRIAEAERQRADTQARWAVESDRHSRCLLYASDMNNAQQALKGNNLGKARLLLDRHRPRSGEEDLRGWEWRYLWQQARSSALVTLTNRPTRGLDVSFSPDGSLLAVGWYDGAVELWDVRERRLVRQLVIAGQYEYGRVAFSPVRNLLAATSDRHTVTFFDLDAGQQTVALRITEEDPYSVNDIAFSQDGSRLVIYVMGGGRMSRDAAYVVSVASGAMESRHATPISFSWFHGAARLSPDNRRLYLPDSNPSSRRYSLRSIDLQSGDELWRTAEQVDYGVTALALSPDGRWLASAAGFEDAAIRIWDAETGRLMIRLDGHTAWTGRLVFSHNGRRLISASADQTIRLWDTGSWTETAALRGHGDEIHAVAVSDEQNLIASVGRDGELMLWRLDTRAGSDGYFAAAEAYHNAWPIALGQSQFLISPGRLAGLSDLTDGVPPSSLPWLIPSEGPFRLFGTNSLCYWDGARKLVIAEWRGTNLLQRDAVELRPGAVPPALAFSPGHQLVSWTERGSAASIYVASLRTPDRRTELKNDLPGIQELLLSPDGNHLAAISADGARVWHLATGKLLLSIKDTWDLAFAAGGRVFVASVARERVDHEIRFHDLSQPERPPRVFPGRDRSRRLAVSPDGRLVAAATDAGQLRWFDAIGMEHLDSIRAHLNAAFSVAFSPDGRRLITSSGGREAVKVWDAGTRQELLTLSGAGSFLSRAGWSSDGDEIVAGSPLQVWRAPSWEEIGAAETKEKAETQRP